MPKPATLLRKTFWSSFVTLLLLVSYIVGAPVIAWTAENRFPSTIPVLTVVYSPLAYYCQHSEFPGSELFQGYVTWCMERLDAVDQ